jgi:hypothetical protein
MNIAELIDRNRHTVTGRARTPATSTGGAGSFTAVMSNQRNSALPSVSAGKGGPTAASFPHIQSPGSAAASGAYGKFIGRSTGTGQCVALVRATNPAIGSTASWVRGDPVQGNASLQPGTAIATFSPSGRYANATDGSSHSAIYLGQTTQGVLVLDQWAGRPAAVPTIPWNHPGAVAANTGCAFHVVNSVESSSA